MEKETVLEELAQISEMLTENEPNPVEALQRRSSWIARVNHLTQHIDRWVAERMAEILEENPKLSDKKVELILPQYIEGRIANLRKRIVKTIELQCSNIRSELIEIASDRKFGNY
jgi:hypothetical protein